jgi:hypothetical protein
MMLAAIQTAAATGSNSASLEVYAIAIVFGALGIFLLRLAWTTGRDEPPNVTRGSTRDADSGA